MNLPNKITLLRVILIPFFIVFMMLDGSAFQWAALIVYVVASLTDFVDGQLARRMNLVTDFGKFMDPLADKMLVAAAMILFVERGIMPAWVVIVIIAREFIVSGFRSFSQQEQQSLLLILVGGSLMLHAARSPRTRFTPSIPNLHCRTIRSCREGHT